MSDVSKRERLWQIPMYTISVFGFRIYLWIWHRFTVKGLKNIPKTGGVLVASNHASFVDPLAVGSGIYNRPVHFMARDTLWSSKMGSWWMDRVGCIPVSRGTGDMKALKTMVKYLQEGKVCSLFPEGTRTEDGELQEAKGGVGFIVKKSGCAVLPVYIDGTFKANPKGSGKVKPVKVTMMIGEVISQEEIDALGDGREAYDGIAALIMARIAALRPEKK
jgi:1-acyl-sn-glycerol-3-phosphate acyltransferase